MNAFFLFSHQQEPANNDYKFLRITPKLHIANEATELRSELDSAAEL